MTRKLYRRTSVATGNNQEIKPSSACLDKNNKQESNMHTARNPILLKSRGFKNRAIRNIKAPAFSKKLAYNKKK